MMRETLIGLAEKRALFINISDVNNVHNNNESDKAATAQFYNR
jgi:hypothetical protein